MAGYIYVYGLCDQLDTTEEAARHHPDTAGETVTTPAAHDAVCTT